MRLSLFIRLWRELRQTVDPNERRRIKREMWRLGVFVVLGTIALVVYGFQWIVRTLATDGY
jgi:hypothetical protein